MKTRSNMPLFVVECEDVKALSNTQIDLLRCGDYLVKKDASGEHAYKVTFKSDTGMCITYHDASVIETQSYDKVDGNWVYNSEDKTDNLLENVKPIYWHSLTLSRSSAGGTLVYYYDFIIINNDATPFTKETFFQWLSQHPTAEIKIVQGYNVGDSDGLVSYFKYGDATSINTFVVDLSTGAITSYTQNIDEGVLTDNGVNKLN